LPLSASCWHNGSLWLRLSGAQAAVDAAVRLIGGEIMPNPACFWEELREQRLPFFGGEDALWRLSVPSTTSPIVLGGVQLIEWGGAQRWLRTDRDAATIRGTVSAAGGHATLFRGGDKSVGVFQPLQPAIARIHERLKNSFDPAHVYNPGRLY
jgi:glycolate oxidase FAD binding subunit